LLKGHNYKDLIISLKKSLNQYLEEIRHIPSYIRLRSHRSVSSLNMYQYLQSFLHLVKRRVDLI